MNRYLVAALLGTLAAGGAGAGPKLTFNDGKSSLEITQTYQVWATWTRNAGDAPQTDSRADLFLKQGRLGLRGQALPSLGYSVIFAFDNIGRDQFTGALGSPQSTSNATFQMYDLYLTYALDSAFANITAGYFRPQTGRENIAPDAGISSLDKGLTSPYLRQFSTGRTNGRETGVNLGGFFGGKLFSAAYNVGVFDPAQQLISGTDGGPRKWHPLITGRVAASLFQADMPSYRLSPELNFFGGRRGITVGGHCGYQGATDETWDTTGMKYDAVKKAYAGSVKYVGGFQKNMTWGVDITANFLGLNVDGEYDRMSRSVNGVSFHHDSMKAAAADFTDGVYHVRAGYDIPVFKTQFIEPTIMYSEFRGSATSVVYPGGSDRVIDAGVNWYVNKNNAKIAVHYLWQGGRPKSMYQSAAPDAKGNVTVRGDMAAVNFQFQF